MSDCPALSEGLDSDPFLNSTLQRFKRKLYHRFGFFLASLSIELITSITCPNETLQAPKMEERMELTDLRKERSELPAISSKYAGLGAAIAAELMICFWFCIGII